MLSGDRYTEHCLSFVVKNFHCFTSLPLFPKKRLQLPAITSIHSIHMQKFAKNFHGYKAIHEKCKSFFTVKNKQYMVLWQYTVFQQ